MFRMQNAAMALMPQAQLGAYPCFEFTYGCGCTYTCGGTGWCHWYFNTVPCVALTTRTVFEVACQNATQPVLPQCGVTMGDPQTGPGGDPLQQLQALRRQLEVALAGVAAQEKVVREQQEAARNQAGGTAAPA